MNKVKDLIKHLNSGIAYVIPLLMIIGLLSYFENDLIIEVTKYLRFAIYPLFSAFLIYSIVDRPGLVPGVVIGLFNAYLDLPYLPLIIISFIVGGFIIGLQIAFKKTPLSIKTLTTVVIMPLLVVLIGGIFLYFWANYINDTLLIIYKVFDNKYFYIIASTILAGLMAYDLGGPINKIAFMLGVISIKVGSNSIYMAAVMAGGMVPPLIIAIDSTINKKKYSEYKRKPYMNYLNGLLFLTEGALLYTQKNPKKFKLYLMIGSALSGLIISIFGIATMFPHGGVLMLWTIERWYIFLVAIFAGAIIVEPFIYKLEV